MKRYTFKPCADCNLGFAAYCSKHLYCRKCSNLRAGIRRQKWVERNGPSRESLESRHRREQLKKHVGMLRSLDNVPAFPDRPGAVAMIDLVFPYDKNVSKNAVYRMTEWHVAIRDEVRSLRDFIALDVKTKCESPWPVGKIWIDLFVQKPDHRSDAVNVLDTICDAVKVGLGIDDRWFAVGLIDWSVVKIDPKIFIRIYRFHDLPQRLCSYCGMILATDRFYKNAAVVGGSDRVCKRCKCLEQELKRQGKGGGTKPSSHLIVREGKYAS